jgi:hypothetical protein
MRPFELLRKGMPVQHEGTSATVASLKMLPPSEQTGIGARGIGSVIAGTSIALQLTLSDKRILVGTVE